MCNAEAILRLVICRAGRPCSTNVIVFGLIPAFKAKSLILRAFSSRISFNVFTINIVTLKKYLDNV